MKKSMNSKDCHPQYKMTQKDRYLEYAARHSKIIDHLAEKDKYYDVMAGAAGVILEITFH